MADTAGAISPARAHRRSQRARRLLTVLTVLFLASAAVGIPILLELPESTSAASAPTSLAAVNSIPATTLAPLLSERPEPVVTTDPANTQVSIDLTSTSTIDPTTSSQPFTGEPLEIDPVFDPIHDRLASTVDIPIRLPATLGNVAQDWTPTISTITADGYVVHLGIGEQCTGASTCRVSTFTARRSNRVQPEIPGSGTPVPLPNDLVGVFSDSTCGSDCRNGFVAWVEDDVLYSVGSRLASGPQVLALTWSAIDSSQPAPAPPEICGYGAPADSGRVARPIISELPDGRSVPWLLMCSADGTAVEILEQEGELRWGDVNTGDSREIIITAENGTTSIFATESNRPRATIDTATSSRLVVGDLRCADVDGNGEMAAFDASTDERLDFINAVTVRRSPVDGFSLADAPTC